MPHTWFRSPERKQAMASFDTAFAMDFDTNKVATVMERYVRLFDALKTQAVRLKENPRLNDNTLTFAHPEIAHHRSKMIQALSRDFTNAESAWLLSHPEVQRRQGYMWTWLAMAESAQERRHSHDLACLNDLKTNHCENYHTLIENELRQLGYPQKQLALRPFESIAFVGAGPLPLSAILLHQKTGLPITCIDCDAQAVALGKTFIEKCGLTKAIAYRHARGDQVDYCIHPYIFIAGLVQDKESVVCQIGLSRGGNTIALRSAMGVGALLDRPLSVQMTELLYIYFDRHTPALPPFFNTTWFSSWPFCRLRAETYAAQLTRPPDFFCEHKLCLTQSKTGHRHAFDFNL